MPKLIEPISSEFDSIDEGFIEKEGGDMTCTTTFTKDEKGLHILDIKHEEPKKSIWKPVSELPEYCCKILVKYTHHNDIIMCDNIKHSIFMEDIKTDLKLVKEFCTLADFINNVESLEARLERLEKLLK